MEPKAIYTIGHGKRERDEFLALLEEYGIDYLVDVRSALPACQRDPCSMR